VCVAQVDTRPLARSPARRVLQELTSPPLRKLRASPALLARIRLSLGALHHARCALWALPQLLARRSALRVLQAL
jgi:hypothetical protein